MGFACIPGIDSVERRPDTGALFTHPLGVST